MNPPRRLAETFAGTFRLALKERHGTRACLGFRTLGGQATARLGGVGDAPLLEPFLEVLGRALALVG